MSVELVGLAYDKKAVDRIWKDETVKSAFWNILHDDFRSKVDFRSMLYHKGQIDLLLELESILRQGGENLTMIEHLAARFMAGLEDAPTISGDLALDYQLIRYFSSLAMVDDFLIAEPFIKALLKKVGYIKGNEPWSLLETRDFEGVATAFKQARMSDIQEAGTSVSTLQGQKVSLESLVRNHIEFLSYSQNNHLTPFFYNSHTTFKQWGDLVERNNERNEAIVELSLKGKIPKGNTGSKAKNDSLLKKLKPNVPSRLKQKREIFSLVGGLRDPDPLIRQKASESLSKLVEPEILPELLAALNDPEAEVRQEVVRAIGSLQTSLAEEALIKVLAEDDVLSVRLTAAFALTQSASREVIPVMFDFIEQRKPLMGTLLAYNAHLKTYKKLNSQLKTLLMHTSPEVRQDVAFILGRLPGKIYEDMLLELVGSEKDAKVCQVALYALWDRKSPRLKNAVKSLSHHKDENIEKNISAIMIWQEGNA